MDKNRDLLAAVESLDNGKAFSVAKGDVASAAACIRYYGGWADKIEGKVIDTNHETFSYTRQEPVSLLKSPHCLSLISLRSVFVPKSFRGTSHCSCGHGKLVLQLPVATQLF